MPESDYEVELFRTQGFVRRECPACGSWFWSLGDHATCGETPCKEYDFLGRPPTAKAFSVHDMREAFLTFLEENGHTRVRRYPVVARWRDDVFYTQASIYPFQPHVIDGVAEPPANPLAISQPCVRFNDIDNVGKTGQHFTMFEMMAHHAFNRKGKEVYFQDRTVELCHEFLASRLGVDPKLVTYKESWWTGGGNSGPCFEVILGGAEVSTLVFMVYRETDGVRTPMDTRVVDTGYGLERLAWITQGTPSAYEAVFGPALEELKRAAGATSIDDRVLREYSCVAGMTKVETLADVRAIRERTAYRLGMSLEDLMAVVAPLEHIYAALDHARALMFVLGDGVVPSNSREGYYARLLVRRGLRALRALGVEIRLSDLVRQSIQDSMQDFPEVVGNRADILRLLDVEERRFAETLSKGRELVRRIEKDLRETGAAAFDEGKLVELYDSHGLTPEIVKEFAELPVSVPDDFFTRVASRHEPAKADKTVRAWPGTPPPTKLRVYEDPDRQTFRAKVLAVEGRGVVLDETYFYPEGGGQEADQGEIDGHPVVDVQPVGDSVVHVLGREPGLVVGSEVACTIDWKRRGRLRRHHTATHILLGAARRVLGNHVWQTGAHKAEDLARLDITHFDALTDEEMGKIAALANEVVLSNRPVQVTSMPRDAAEREYGFRLYQGGFVPGGTLRVVSVEGWDVEACGGTHVRQTSEVGSIRLLRSTRIQDGVVRLEYLAGAAALEYAQKESHLLEEVRMRLGVPLDQVVDAVDRIQEEARDLRRRLAAMERSAVETAVRGEGFEEGARQVPFGDRAVETRVFRVGNVRIWKALLDPGTPDDLRRFAFPIVGAPGNVVILGARGDTASLLVARSEDVRLDCLAIVREAAKLVGGGGGGQSDFAQGGGTNASRVADALEVAVSVVRVKLQG